MQDKESHRIRHCAFIIDNYTEKDLEKLRQVNEQIKQKKSMKFKFLTYVEDGNKVYGYSISSPRQLSFKNLRNILSAKATKADMGDFKQDMDGKYSIKTHPHAHTHTHTHSHNHTHNHTHTITYTSGEEYKQVYYDDRGDVEMAGKYSSKGSRGDASERGNELEQGLEEADCGNGFDDILEKWPRLSVSQQKQIKTRVNKVREDKEMKRVALESSQRVLKPWEKHIIRVIEKLGSNGVSLYIFDMIIS